MSNLLKAGAWMTLALAIPQAIMAQSTVFSDDFGNGSTLNATSMPSGGDSTSYDIASSKAATTGTSIAAGDLTLGLNAATGSGFVELQALFTSSPITLATPGDYVDLTYTFVNTGNLLAGGSSSGIFSGLYQSGGYTPVAGSLNNSGLSTTTGSAFATGNAANWQGYASRIYATGGTSEIYTRPQQTSGTTSANQDLIGNGFGSGTYVAVPGTLIGSSSSASTAALTAGGTYTSDYRLTLSSAGALTISENLYAGTGTQGTDLSSQSYQTSGSLLTTTFDGLAIGIRNSGTSLDPQMGIDQITVSAEVQPVPEPNTFVLFGLGMVLLQGARRRFNKRS